MSWADSAYAIRHWGDAAGMVAQQLTELLEATYLTLLPYSTLPGRAVVDGVTTSGSTTLTSAVAEFGPGDVGRGVSGVGIPVGATIVSRVDLSTVVLSVAATASGSGLTVTLGDLAADDRHKQANVMQAREVYTAYKRSESADVVGIGDFAIRAKPLPAVVKMLLGNSSAFLVG